MASRVLLSARVGWALAVLAALLVSRTPHGVAVGGVLVGAGASVVFTATTAGVVVDLALLGLVNADLARSRRTGR